MKLDVFVKTEVLRVNVLLSVNSASHSRGKGPLMARAARHV